MKWSKRQVFGLVAMVLVAAVAVGGIALWLRHNKLEQLQNKALEELERNAGQYDEQSIVLYETSKAKAEELAKLYGAKLRITENGRFATLTLPEGTTIRDVYALEESRQHIGDMAADYHVQTSDLTEEGGGERLPTRPQYTVSDSDYELQTYLDYLNMSTVWNNYTGSGVTVAVIDTGIDTDHPEFAGRISEYSYNATEDKIVKDYNDWSLIEDEVGHGTAVTGVIAAAMDGSGVLGIAPNVNILVIKAECNANGTFARSSDLVFGLYYAIERDVQIVNMSFGTNEEENPFAAAIRLAYDSDVICVAAAGNCGTSGTTWPASDELVIGVGALDAWNLAYYSNYGENVDVCAPGSTYTTLNDGQYGYMQGTSLAAPIVAGAIALYMQTNKYATFEDVTELLYASCYDLGTPGRDWEYGFGALDISAFILEERGTVTFDMLTDEVDDLNGIFVNGHALQELPEPERLYYIFDGWYYDDTCTQEVDYYTDAFYGDVTLYAKWANEDEGLPYTYIVLDDGTVEITGYTGHRRYITIPEKIDGRIVSSIGQYAFAGQTGLREVTLPDGLTNIGAYAFRNCANLLRVEIPAGVRQIGQCAFADCVRLSGVAFLGQQLTDVGSGAFQYCSRLERIELPASLTHMSGSAFLGATSLTYIGVQDGNTAFVSKEGVLFNHSGTTLIAYPAAHGSEYTLPEGVTHVGACAFAFAKLTEIDLSGVQNLANHAFTQSSLETLVLPDTLTTMGESAFYGSFCLRQITIGAGLTELPEEAFCYCSSLNTVMIPHQITKIGYGAFAFSGLSTVTFEAGSSLTIIDGAVFFACAISEIDIPDAVTDIGNQAFAANQSLKRIGFGTQSKLQRIGNNAFESCKLLTAVELPASLTSIGDGAFRSTALTQIHIPAGVTSVGDGAFARCTKLVAFTVAEDNAVYHAVDGILFSRDNAVLHAYPGGMAAAEYVISDTVRSIRPYAFSGSWSLDAIVLPEGMTELGAYALYDSGISRVELPESLTAICEYALAKCLDLRSVQIPDGVVKIGRYAFQGDWALTSVAFSETSQLPRISYGAFANCGISSFVVPANVSSIAQGAFMGCGNLVQLTFADNSKLESISAYMFSGCSNLQSITFGQGSALKSIQAHGLEGMDHLTAINLETTQLANIDNFAFRFCRSLSSLQLPETLTNIGRYAFYGCESLAQLTVPANVEHIGPYAFLATNDIELYFANEALPAYLDENWDHGTRGYYLGVTSVAESGDYRYAVLTSGSIAILEYLGSDTAVDLTALDLGAPITQIGGSAFQDSTVTSIVLPETLTTIQAEAFQFTDLQSITIPTAVTFIGREAFAYTDLQTVSFAVGSQLSVMEQYAFAGTDNLKAVTLPASLTTMGTGVFMESGLQSVTFEQGTQLTEIPQKAFAETQLTSIILPDSVTLVDHNAFHNVQTLKSVTFGNNDGIRLMSNAFYHTGLTSLHIPANVTYIGEFCFAGLFDLAEFTVAADNTNYKAEAGLLLSKDGRRLIAAPSAKTGSITLPASVEIIGAAAFEESSLSEVLFSENANILTIGHRAFFKSAITQITIPASVVSIDYYAFGYCESLQSVIFAEGNALKGIYEGAFIGCVALTDITVPRSVAEISEFAFYGCGELEQLPLTENSALKGIYDYAFAYSGLSDELTVPDGVLDIGEYAFLATKVCEVTISDANKKDLIIGIGAFEECNQLTEITVPFIGASFEDDHLSWFGYIFGAGSYKANGIYVPASLKMVTVSEGITEVGPGGFAYCTGLEIINVPHTVSVLWDYAFLDVTAKCELTNTITAYHTLWGNVSSSLLSFHISKGICGQVKLSDEVISIGDDAFENCTALKQIVLSSSITSINGAAFAGCTGLTDVTLSTGLTWISRDAFAGCTSLQNVYVPDIESWCNIVFANASANPMAFSSGHYEEGGPRNLYIDGKLLTELTIPEGMTAVNDYCFFDCASLTKVHIPSSVTSLGASAFANCVNLESITLEEGLESIGASAFNGCGKMKTVTLPQTLTFIGEYAFQDCEALQEIRVPGGVTQLQSGTFANCISLESIQLPDSVTAIEAHSFSGCTNLAAVILPDTVASIGEYAFSGCAGLESIYLPDVITVIERNTFEGCTSLLEVTVPDSTTTIGASAFLHCSGMKSAVIGSGVTEIGASAFEGCTALESVSIGSSVAKICACAFEGCEKLQDVYIFDVAAWCGIEFEISRFTNIHVGVHMAVLSNPMHYAQNLYLNGELLTELVIPEGVTAIQPYVFEGINHIGSVQIPSTVEKIGECAFGPNPMDALHISDLAAWCAIDFAEYGANPIYYVQKVYVGGEECSEIVIPEGVTAISPRAFAQCESIIGVTIPASVTEIGQDAFLDCENLLHVQNNSSLELVCGSADNGYVACYAKLVTDKDGNRNYREDGSGATYFSTADGYLFVQENGAYYLIAYLGDQDTITLPESANGEPYQLRNFLGGVHVIIPEGVTELSDSAFAGNTTLKSVTLPESLTEIGWYAFRNCVALKEIPIPAGVKYIRGFAFAGSGITEIVIPDGVTMLGQDVFNKCIALERVVLSKNLRDLGWNGFSGCTALKEIELPTGITQINDAAFWGCSSLTSIVIPDGVTSIGGQAFAFCESLTSVTIPNSVTSIESHAFQDCTSLRYIAIPESVTEIGTDAFPMHTKVEFLGENPNFQMIDGILYNGDLTKILSVSSSVSGHIVIPDTVTTIFAGAFQNCTELTGITIGSGVTVIEDNAFYGCIALETVVMGENVESIWMDAFRDCTSLVNITLPERLAELGDGVFDGCTALKHIVIGGGVEYLSSAFRGCTALEEVILEYGITQIGYACFEGCTSLKNISIPSSVAEIGESAFKNCTSLEKLVVPEGVEVLHDYALYGCTGLKDLTLPTTLKTVDFIFGYSQFELENVYISDIVAWCAINFERDMATPMYLADNLYLNGELLTDLVIPEGVTSIGKYAFYGISHLESVTIPSSVTSIGENAFADCDGLQNIYASDLRSWCGIAFENSGANPMAYNWESKPKNLYIGGQLLTEVTIPEDLTEVGAYAFCDCTTLTKVYIPDGVTKIGDYAFAGCTNLISISIPKGITAIGSCAFYHCMNLKQIALPDSVAEIGYSAFFGCSSLTELCIPDGVTEIGTCTFEGCSALQKITIADSVLSIGDRAFRECESLTSILLPEDLTSLGTMVFDGCAALTEITIPDGVTVIDNDTFAGCDSLRTVIIGKGVATIDEYAFGWASNAQCISLEQIIVDPENEHYCSVDGILYDKLTTKIMYSPLNLSGAITIPEGITEIGRDDLFGGDMVTSITIPASVTAIDEDAFSAWGRYPNLEEIIVAEGNAHYCSVSGILYNADMTEIVHIPDKISGDVVIPEGITAINSYALNGCSRIESVTLPAGLIVIGEEAFEGCTSLCSINLPEGLTEIGRYAFRNCTSLLSITLPGSLQTMDYGAFDGCVKLYIVHNNSNLELSLEDWDCHDSDVDRYAKMLVDKDGNVTYAGGITDFSYVITDDGYCFVCENGEYTMVDYIGEEDDLVLPEYINGKTYRIFHFTRGVSITIPQSMTQISEEAFYGNQNLRRITLHDGIASIQYGAFSGCTNLEEIHIPQSVTSIASSAFYNCDSLTSIVIPDSVTTIEDRAFSGCGNLTSVMIGDGVTVVGSEAFNYCSNLRELTIGKKVVNIGIGAFDGCNALYSNEAYWNNGMMVIDGWLFDVQEDLQYLTNPQDLRGAISSAYDGCYQLKNAVWGSSLQGLTNVETIYITTLEGVYHIPALLTLKNIVICDSVKAADMQKAGYAFSGLSGVTIYVEHDENDLRWDENFPGWNYGNRVVYGDAWIQTTFFAPDGSLLRMDIMLTSAVIRRPVVTLPEDQEYISYEFLGWDLDGDGLVDSLPATSLTDVSAVAVIGSQVRKFTVTFANAQTGEVYWQQQIAYGSPIPLPQAPAADGKSFIGWEGYEEGIVVTGDVTFTALWHEHSYGQWYVETADTCTEDGQMARKCDGCGAVETQVITAEGHALSYKCDKTGHWQACEHCDYVTDPEEHSGEVCDVCGYDSRVLPGDVNGDGRVNARDARALLRYIAGLIEADEIVLAAADYNGDGRINARDARAILRHIAGLD